MKRIAVLFVCALSCVQSEYAEEIRSITVTYSGGASHWPLLIAKEAGYFKASGLEARMTLALHPVEIAMLVSGEADFASYSLTQMLQAASRGAPLTIVASPMNKGMFVLLANQRIQSIRELRGKKVAIGQIGDATYGY